MTNSSYTVTVEPVSEPLSRTEVKNYLKVTGSTDDDLIDLLIESARQQAEGYTNRKLMVQTIEQKYDSFPAEMFLLVAPYRAISSIQYTDENGATQTLSSAVYVVSDYETPVRLSLAEGQTWPDTIAEDQAVTLTYTVGYDDAASVPGAIRNAMLKIIASAYDRRDTMVKKLPTDAETMLAYYRNVR